MEKLGWAYHAAPSSFGPFRGWALNRCYRDDHNQEALPHYSFHLSQTLKQKIYGCELSMRRAYLPGEAYNGADFPESP